MYPLVPLPGTQVLVQLGAPDGIFFAAQRHRLSLGPSRQTGASPPFARLEEHLSLYQRFFVRYTTEGACATCTLTGHNLPPPHPPPRPLTFSPCRVHTTHDHRHAWPDFLQATLCGSEPVDLFDSFHVQLRALTNQLMADFQLPPDVQARLAIQPPEEFEIASNVKRTVDRY